MCGFDGIYHFFASWFQIFFSLPYQQKTFFQSPVRHPKLPKIEKRRKQKLQRLAFWFICNLSKFEKTKKKFFEKKFFFIKMTQKKKFFFGQKNRKSSLIHQNDGLDEQITIMDAFFSFGKFLGHFWSIFWSRSGVGPIRPYIYIRQSHLYIVQGLLGPPDPDQKIDQKFPKKLSQTKKPSIIVISSSRQSF